MKENEDYAYQMATQYIGNEKPLNKRVKKLGEEVLELAMAIQKEDYNGHIEEELGDCLFILAHIGRQINPNKSLSDYLKETALKVRIRNLNYGEVLISNSELEVSSLDGSKIKIQPRERVFVFDVDKKDQTVTLYVIPEGISSYPAKNQFELIFADLIHFFNIN